MHYNIPLSEVENTSINEYRLMLFSIFNNAALMNGLNEFKYKTEDEEEADFEDLVSYYKQKGFFSGR